MKVLAAVMALGLATAGALAMPGMGGVPGKAMPPGHPQVGPAPTTQPASSGAVAIKAVQGTQNGPAVAEEKFVLELYHQSRVIHKTEGKLDAHGVATVENLPVLVPCQPVVTVSRQGVDYRGMGTALDAHHPNQTIEVKVYETAEQAPAWSVRMRHVSAYPQPQGVRVVEMLAVDNPTDRAWIGLAGADGKRATVVLPIPGGAKDVQLGGGLHSCCVKVEDGRLTSTIALNPGLTKMQVAYTLEAKNGAVNVAVTAPAAVGHMMLFVPDDGTQANPSGLEVAGVHDMGRGKMRAFKAANLAAGQQTGVTLTNLPAEANTAAAKSSDAPKIIAAIGGALILAVGFGVLMLKAPKGKSK